MNKLRMAVVGAGRLGGFHAQKIMGLPQAELVAVADPSPAARDRVAAECLAQAVADHRELFGQVDAVVIASPTKLHHKLAMEFLESGAHVLVEKPICGTLAEAEELVETARRRGRTLQVGHVERFNPAFTAAAPHVRVPKYIEAVRASGFTFRSTDVGVVLDLMIHDIDLVLSMVRSPVRKVEALGLSVLGGHEDVANARIVFECGCVASLSASRVSYEPLRRMHAWSARGFASVDFATRTTTLVRPSETLLRREFAFDAAEPDQVERLQEELVEEHLAREQKQFEAVDALSLELRDFVDAIRLGRAPRVDGAAGRDAIALAEQIVACIGSHAWDDAPDGPQGPLAAPPRHAISAPHLLAMPQPPAPRRQAG